MSKTTKTGASAGLDHVSAPRVPVPPRSCDCHVHIFDPARFPYVPQRTYTPGTATVQDLLAFERRLGIERVVLVQPSGYGTDNRCLVDALAQLGKDRARGVAVIDPQRTTAAELEALHSAGVRSIRLNLEVRGDHSADRARAAVKQALDVVSGPKWSIQIYADLKVIDGISDTLAEAKTPIVLDHFGGLRAEQGINQEGFSKLVTLARERNVYVKLSAPYRASKHPDYADLAPYVRALVDAAPQHLIWASDWPHTGSSSNRGGDLSQVEPFRVINDGQVLDLLAQWVPEARMRQEILAENAARLYGFA
ncbi:amidohydrolase family protein [Variovorax ureilyticus]|uniref:Amidohydrolase family protein n=1 Tax=Variovorax ureilyticus TaxID=1836198 RepID=A0ABU8VGQ2_9BURK